MKVAFNRLKKDYKIIQGFGPTEYKVELFVINLRHFLKRFGPFDITGQRRYINLGLHDFILLTSMVYVNLTSDDYFGFLRDVHLLRSEQMKLEADQVVKVDLD